MVYLLTGFKDMFLLLGGFAVLSSTSQSRGASHPQIGGLGGHSETNVLGSEIRMVGGGEGDHAFRASFSVSSNNTKQLTNIKYITPGVQQPSCAGSSCSQPGLIMELLWRPNLT